MEKKRPQLSLDELQQVRWLLGGVLALFSVWAVFYLDVEAWSLLLLNTIAIPAVLVRPDLPARVPRWVHLAAFPAMVAFFVADLWLTSQVLPPMVRLDLMLILYRATSYRKRRDDLQLIVLGLFLVVLGGVLTVSLAFAVQILAFTACALALMLVITLTDSATPPAIGGEKPVAERSGKVVPTWACVDRRRLFFRLRAVTDWRVAAVGAVLFAGVVAVSALLFLAIPRFQLENSLFLERLIAKKSKTGFSDNIRFGDVTDIMEDTSVALSVEVSDLRVLPETLYLRMVVLDDYQNGAFRLSTPLRSTVFDRERNTMTVRGTERSRGADSAQWTFYFEPGISRYLPLPGSFETLGFSELQSVSASRELRAVALRNDPVKMTAYRITGVTTAPALRDLDFARRFEHLASAADNPRRAGSMQLALVFSPEERAELEGLLREIVGPNSTATAGALPPADFARRAAAWLGQRHSYSLQSEIPPGRHDPLVRWITSTQPGHCELFAGAFVVLARSAGYPARVISGFKGGTWNAYSGNLTVRNSDAHAWAEIWDAASTSWLRVDPTPGAATMGAEELRGEAALALRMDRSWTARLDSLRVFWYRRIVNFDQRSQLETLRAMKSVTQDTGRRIRAALDRGAQAVKDWLLEPWDFRRGIILLAVMIAGAANVWLMRRGLRGWRWRRRSRSVGRRDDPVRREAGKWLGRLADAGADETDVRAELQRLRYGARGTWSEPEKAFRRARTAYRAARRR